MPSGWTRAVFVNHAGRAAIDENWLPARRAGPQRLGSEGGGQRPLNQSRDWARGERSSVFRTLPAALRGSSGRMTKDRGTL